MEVFYFRGAKLFCIDVMWFGMLSGVHKSFCSLRGDTQKFNKGITLK